MAPQTRKMATGTLEKSREQMSRICKAWDCEPEDVESYFPCYASIKGRSGEPQSFVEWHTLIRDHLVKIAEEIPDRSLALRHILRQRKLRREGLASAAGIRRHPENIGTIFWDVRDAVLSYKKKVDVTHDKDVYIQEELGESTHSDTSHNDAPPSEKYEEEGKRPSGSERDEDAEQDESPGNDEEEQSRIDIETPLQDTPASPSEVEQITRELSIASIEPGTVAQTIETVPIVGYNNDPHTFHAGDIISRKRGFGLMMDTEVSAEDYNELVEDRSLLLQQLKAKAKAETFNAEASRARKKRCHGEGEGSRGDMLQATEQEFKCRARALDAEVEQYKVARQQLLLKIKARKDGH